MEINFADFTWMNKLKKSLLLILGLLLTANYGFSQSFDKIINTLKVYQINNPDSLLSFPDLKEEEKLYIKAQINLIVFSEIDSLIFNKSVSLPSITERGKTLKSLIASDYYLYNSFPEDSIASAFETNSGSKNWSSLGINRTLTVFREDKISLISSIVWIKTTF